MQTNAQAKAAPAAPHNMAEALGQIVWLLSQSPIYGEMKIKDLEWSFMPPLLHAQFRMFSFGPLPGMDEQTLRTLAPLGFTQEGLERMPLGVALWALLSEEAEARMDRGERLKMEDWRSGNRLWLVELISPFSTPENKLIDAMMLDLMQGPFRDRPFSLHRTDPATGRRDRINVASHLRR